MTKREVAIEVLKNQINKPYKWGGNDPLEGYDCSGLVVEMLQSVGIIGRNEDYTADDMFRKFPDTDILEPGTLVFWDWDGDGKMDHVEVIALIDDDGQLYTIGSSGGTYATNSPEQASRDDAYIKLRPLMPDHAQAVNPFEGAERK